ncbi:LytR C-terminal domain-containing protein [bacterium]|nr:LytR C-terminal domain-containing protein [bacterium]
MSHRRRRIQPLRKPNKPIQPRKRPVKKIRSDWKSNLIQFFIGLVLVIDMVLVYFIIRNCSSQAVVPVEEPTVQAVPEILQIEVLNGCGVQGVAAQLTDYLRSQGFDVVKTDNFESFNVIETVVIDRRGNLENGIRIAKALGLGEERVLQEVNDAYLIDATLVIGKDFKNLNGWQSIE